MLSSVRVLLYFSSCFITLSRYIRYYSHCSRPWFDLNPYSMSVSDNLSNECFGRFRCFGRGKSGIDFEWAQWLLKLNRNAASVCLPHCILHPLHWSKDITSDETNVKYTLVFIQNWKCIAASRHLLYLLQTWRLGFTQDVGSQCGAKEFSREFTSVSLGWRGRLYTAPGANGKPRLRRSLCSRMLQCRLKIILTYV